MNKIHEIFPLIVYQGKVDCHEEFKNNHLKSLKDYWFNGYENETPENSGRCSLHLNQNYKIFFDSLKKSVNRYL